MRLAYQVAQRATCRRRSVGAILVDEDSHILATGYNGVARGMPHCLDSPCPGVLSRSGEGLDTCEAIHAEQNALLQCREPNRIVTIYVTTAPCATCSKLLLATNCQRIVYVEPYEKHEHWLAYWQKAGRRVHMLPYPSVFVPMKGAS